MTRIPVHRLLFASLLLFALAHGGGGLPNSAAQESTRQIIGSLFWQDIARGVEHAQKKVGHETKDGSTGPWFINVLRIDLSQAQIKVARALDAGVGLETVSSLVARHGAVAGVNGGYFRTTGTYRGESLGFFSLDGRVLSEPHNNRAGVGFSRTGTSTHVIFGHIKFDADVSLGRATRKVDGLNRPRGENELIVFTPEFHRTTLTGHDGLEVVVRGNRVVEVRDLKGSAEIPRNGYVVSANGSAREWTRRNVKKGSASRFSWKLSSFEPDDDENHWRRSYAILGAGPQLIRNGKISITHVEEKMAPGFAADLHPRTAIARLSSGKLLLLTVDGRQPGHSVGMSLQTLAELLMELGATEALNLDGGGGTTMVVKNKVLNRPSDQTGERPISDAILVFAKAK